MSPNAGGGGSCGVSANEYTDQKNIKFSSYIRKFKVEQLQTYIWKGFLTYEERLKYFPMRRPLVIYDFATAQF
jgi:hypothetical protein